MQNAGATVEELNEALGKGRAKLGMFDGDLQEGELEIGQVASLINKVQAVNEIVAEMIEEYENRLKGICKMIKL
jgi:enoyl-[acyl-carrier protein] reductase II